MAWKRQIHRRYGTPLIETTSDDFDRKVLDERLTDLLWVFGIEPRPLTKEEAEALASETNKVFTQFVELIETFLHLYKGSELTSDVVYSRISGERDLVFRDLFWILREAYEQELESRQHIDFDDMIVLARRHLQQREALAQYKYIIIDEFQDITRTRLGLVQDVRAHRPHARIFAVGDDWQSIYRFSGSDLTVMTHLPDMVGTTERVDLDRTYRFDAAMLAASTCFITKNPDQLSKRLTARSVVGDEKPIWAIVYPSRAGAPSDRGLLATLDLIGRHRERVRPRRTGPSTVFVIGRYNFTLPDKQTQPTLHSYAARLGLKLHFITAHKSKGLEHDYAIVLDFEKATMGFPTDIVDDPVLKMVLSSPESFPHAEERRLCYVAITRSRFRTYMLVPAGNPSSFMHSDFWTEEMASWVETVTIE